MRCKRIVLMVNWLELFVQEVDSESLESVDARDLKTFSWNSKSVHLLHGFYTHHLDRIDVYTSYKRQTL